MLQRACLASLLSLSLVAAACGGGDSTGTGTGGGGAGGSGGGGGNGDPTHVVTDKGPVKGAVMGDTRVFLGIPYAAPPVGERRFKAPAPHDAWTDEIDATARGPACAQLSALSPSFDSSSSEDCLTLNVWAPAAASSSKPAPVMVWIHGGTFIIGSGGDASYDGQKLSEATGAVVVTINYRLGPLGFLALPELASEDPGHPTSGTYGIEDQRAALAWARDNIAAFGGDPANVTLFGESAGGVSTCYHLVSPGSAGLFHRAIIESGACALGLTKSKAAAEDKGQKLVDKLGCTADPVACLRGKTAEEILLAMPASAVDLSAEGGWGPDIDGVNIPADPASLFAAGTFNKVPTLLGSNEDEGTLFFALGSPVTDDASYLALAEQLAPGKGDAIVAQYPSATFGSAKAAAAAVLGDAGFVCPARRTARLLAKAGVATYLYHFTHAPEGALVAGLGSFHSAEIPYVFGNPFQLLPKSPTEAEEPLLAAMQGYWGRMAVAGDPNGDGAVAWPAYDEEADENIVLDLMVSKQAGLREAECDFWDSLGI